MRISASVLALTLILGVALSCKLGERLAGDKNAGTVSALWPYVPPFQGATKADLEIPLGARLFIRGMMQGESMMQAAGMGGEQQGQGQGGSRELNRALDTGTSRMNMTGPARGERVVSEEPSGESVPHTVGRGVIHR